MAEKNISEKPVSPLKVLNEYWGYSGFRPLQEEIIEQLLSGKDTLALLPTGGGKSICYQVPGMILDGLCIVISPLLALINDQISNLKSKGIQAETVNSQISRSDIDRILDNCIYGNVKFLFISPERISNELFQARLSKMNVSMITVDEAHCISQWGHDFRPAYRRISELRELLPKTPVLALTATATEKVTIDIQNQLTFNELNVLKQSFNRTNINFISKCTEDKRGVLITAVSNAPKGAGIIYVRSRRKCKELADIIAEIDSVSSTYYHAGLSREQRSVAQSKWMSDEAQWIVATNAFGMGIDKADVRTVIHYDVSDGIESYYQEAGRAGRDGKESWAVQIFNNSDTKDAIAKVIKSHPAVEKIKDVYRVMSDRLQLAAGSGESETFGIDIAELAKRCKLGTYTTIGALKCLEQNGYVQVSQGITQPSKLQILADRKKVSELEAKASPMRRLIHSLIRSRSGLFADLAIVREEELAELTGIPTLEVTRLLSQAMKMGLVEYVPRTGSSSVTYLVGRVRTEDLRLNTKLMHELRSRSMNRQQLLNQYLENKLDCRSRQLMAYFDESLQEDCGHCDVCQRSTSSKSRAEDISFIRSLRVELTEPKALQQIKELCDSEQKSKLVRWTLDKGYIQINDSLVTWTGPQLIAVPESSPSQ